MAAREWESEVEELDGVLKSIEAVLNLPKLEKEAEELEQEASTPNLWDDPEKAQVVTSKLSRVQSTLNRAKTIRRHLEEIPLLYELANEEKDAAAIADAGNELDIIAKTIRELEVQTLLNGEYDDRDALVTIRSEAGGVEAADWAQMVQRMYLRYCERKGYKTEILEESDGDVGGIKSATIKVDGEYAYGHLRSETGVHRLVRKSPFDSSNGRHTSFASIYVYPEIDDSIEIEVNPADIRTDTYRASGAGGQHINKTDSAVRLTHVPTGIVVQCQNDRSQHRNRAEAMSMLKSRLYEHEMQKRRAEQDKLEASKTDVGWGHQIRSYVLDQSRIKDLRTNVEISNTQKVLDGDLDAFIEASLKQGV